MTLTMESTSAERIVEIREKQRKYFHSGATLDVKARKAALKKFEQAVLKWEKPLCDALWTDLHKSYEEAYLTEISILLGEIRTHIRKIGKWTRPQRKCTPLKLFPSSSRIVSEPLGTALIISPWNYPVQLLLTPLVGAISAGCTAVLKPSPYVPTVSKVIEDMICDTFPEEYVAVTQGHRDVNGLLLEQRWDMIFFTGSPSLGRLVMASAAKNLTPVVLELGGKSPCIIDKDADIRTAAKRVAWGKSLNAGQTCTALSRFLVPAEKLQTAEALLKSVLADYPMGDPTDPATRMGPLISGAQFERVREYISSGIREGARLVAGGLPPEPGADDGWFVPPVVFSDVRPEMRIAQEEIFGPVLSVMPYNTLEEALAIADGTQYGLCGAVFGPHEAAVNFARRMRTGNVYVNDASRDLAAPFGGFKSSGVGREGGVFGLLEFTEPKAIFEHGS